MLKKIFMAAALALVATFSSATSAQAAPLFLDPNVNYVSHGDALFVQDANNYSLTVNTAVGDFMSMDTGTGYGALSTATLNVNVSGGVGSFALTIGSGDSLRFVTGSLLTDGMTNNLVGGKDIFAVFRITESNLDGFIVGQLAGFDAFGWNPHSLEQGITAMRAKGDLAPVVPEPATMSLLVVGLAGLAAGARRKLS